AIGERTHGIGPLLRRDTRGETVTDIDRNRKGSAERRVVRRYHGIELEAFRLLHGERRADDARGIADDESHLFGRTQRSRNEQIAPVLGVVVTGAAHDPAGGKGCQYGLHPLMVIEHFCPTPFRPGRTAMPASRPSAHADADSDRRSRMPPWPRRSAPRECRRRDRGVPWC